MGSTTSGSGASEVHSYDGNLKRVRTVKNGKTTLWVYSALTGTPIYADQVTDNVQTHYLSGGGARIRLKNGVAEYVHLDHQGSPYAATNSSGAVAWTQEYRSVNSASVPMATLTILATQAT